MNKRLVVVDHAFPDLSFEENVAAEHGASFSAYSCTNEAEVVNAVETADTVLVNFAPITSAVLSRMKSGATIVRYGVGYDNVDIESARACGISVANVPDYGTEAVADHAVAGLLALARRLVVYNDRIHAEGWLLPGDIGAVPSLRSMTVGFIGMGKIAVAVHARLVAFGFAFVAYDPYCNWETLAELNIEQVSLAELARRSHAISLHARSTPETFRIVGRNFLSRVQQGVILVNTARGALIDETALVDALADGTVAAAALDVTDPEPVPSDSPLRTFAQVVLTPHAAFYDDEALRTLQRLASEEAGRALRNEPLRCRIA